MQHAPELQLAQELLQRSAAFAAAKVKECQPLAGDASGRRYVRLILDDAGASPTLILMLLKRTKGPVTHGGDELDQDQTFTALSIFLRAHGLHVPELLVDGRDHDALIVEDVGDLPLWRFAFNQLNESGLRIRRALGDEAVPHLYRRAVDCLRQIQRIPADQECVAFRRSMEFDQYHLEARRFVDHYLGPDSLPKPQLDVIERMLKELCEEVASHRRCLMHRDFMPWNIHICAPDDLAILDFQDMLLGSWTYDIVSLIHDRDADAALGKERCIEIAEYFAKGDPSGAFYRCYHQVLLQRYLRLAGQFRLLSQRWNTPVYDGWVPGCLTRIGRSLAVLPEMADVLEILANAIPEVKRGAADPWLHG